MINKIILVILMLLVLIFIIGCVEQQENKCLKEGEWGLYPCCEGLVPVACADYLEESGLCAIADCGSACVKCGNGECGIGENRCNCPEDCGEIPENII